jgi:hypothetical protein
MQYLPIRSQRLTSQPIRPAKARGTKASLTAIGNGITPLMGLRFLWCKRPGLTEFCNLGEGAKVDGLHYWTRQDVLAASCNGKMFKITETGTKTDITGARHR